MSASELAALARARGLGETGKILDGFAAPQLVDANRVPADPRLVEPPHDSHKRILPQLARRGLDPTLVRALWKWLDGRPLERALVAVDVLARSLLPPDDPFAGELALAAVTLGPLRPPPGSVGIDLNEHPAATLVARFARDAGVRARVVAELLVRSYDFDLGALDALAERGHELVASASTHESIRAFGKLLSLARLPTLASLYLDWVSRPLGYRRAAIDLCETLFDAGEPQKIPGDAIRPGDFKDADVEDGAAYLVCRMHTSRGRMQDGWEVCEKNWSQRDPKLGAPRDRLLVARAHLGTLAGARPAMLDAVSKATKRDPAWRYGAHVRAVVAAAQLPATSKEPLQLAHDYVTGFGNDLGFWREFVSVVPPSAPLRADALAILAREAAALPHEPAVWQALTLLIAGARGAEPAHRELAARLDAQARS
jgi:hypothetical protein